MRCSVLPPQSNFIRKATVCLLSFIPICAESEAVGMVINMNIEWKYKIEVANTDVFAEIEKERHISFPNELKELIIEANAATPAKYNFMAGSVEKALGAILSFNRNEADTDSVFVALSVISDTNLLPFGIDPFGNYICYSLKDKSVVFWDHETDGITAVSNSLSAFLESLY